MSTLLTYAEHVTRSGLTSANLDMSLLPTTHSWWQSPSWHQADIHPFHHAAGGPVHSDGGVRVSPQTHGSCPGSPSREPGQEEHALLCESVDKAGNVPCFCHRPYQWATLSNTQTHAGVYFDSGLHSPSCCPRYSVEHQMWISVKIVLGKWTVSSCKSEVWKRCWIILIMFSMKFHFHLQNVAVWLHSNSSVRFVVWRV